MKTKLFTLLITLIFCVPNAFAGVNGGGCMVQGACSGKRANFNKNFKRTFTYKKNTVNKNAHKKNADDISITLNDFSEHLAVGKNRIVTAINSPITMDIGAIESGTKETWVLPNPAGLSTSTTTYKQIEATGTDIVDSFGLGTHVLYSEETENYELYVLDDEELFFKGFTTIENGELIEYNYDQAKAPVPVEYGNEHISVVNFMDEDTPGTFTLYTDTYNIIGQGTLQTYDDGSADALKMIYTEDTREYVNYELVDHFVRYEVVFYSKKGHYITADIEDPNDEGSVTLEGLVYRKLEQKTASTNSQNNAAPKMFPNPVNAGQVLKFESLVSLKDSTVEVYNINGQKVSALVLQESKNNQYEITVPKNLSSGLYFYNLKNIEGSVVTNGKIQIK